jgi:hypothetical protein
MKPILDKAEVALEYPDKVYIGTFERSARFDAHLDETGISLTLHRTGDSETRRSVHMHFHYALFADILRDLARTVSAMPPENGAHREAVRNAARALHLSLDRPATSVRKAGRASKAGDISELTPEEEVLLLHVLE